MTLLLLLCRDVSLIDAYTTAILSTWRELFATTVRGVDRVMFYGAPLPALLTLFSIWPADILVMVTPDDEYAGVWLPQPVHSWSLMEDGKQAMRQLPVTPAIEQFMNNDDVVIDDVFLSPPHPPSYDEAVSSSPHPVVNLISDDEEDGDDDVFVN